MAAPFRIFIPKPEEGEEFKLSDLSKADAAALTEVFNSYAGHNVTCGIGRSRPTAEDREAQKHEKEQRKADRAAIQAAKTAERLEKVRARADKAQEAIKALEAKTIPAKAAPKKSSKGKK